MDFQERLCFLLLLSFTIVCFTHQFPLGMYSTFITMLNILSFLHDIEKNHGIFFLIFNLFDNLAKRISHDISFYLQRMRRLCSPTMIHHIIIINPLLHWMCLLHFRVCLFIFLHNIHFLHKLSICYLFSTKTVVGSQVGMHFIVNDLAKAFSQDNSCYLQVMRILCSPTMTLDIPFAGLLLHHWMYPLHF